jgi:hypothetical protein
MKPANVLKHGCKIESIMLSICVHGRALNRTLADAY